MVMYSDDLIPNFTKIYLLKPNDSFLMNFSSSQKLFQNSVFTDFVKFIENFYCECVIVLNTVQFKTNLYISFPHISSSFPHWNSLRTVELQSVQK
ncbi:hypothetical protein BpHYR1_054124 [Brachionus plicatilis]|uniref:Uncharacterized protein n=1 Tax=Brachionus plicatilis TaxID=10195 RepID=A0A3M7SMW1_BRAPC|nr:hypothetical protein BpHYR1_054124 [Brachionus plicatilis]